MTSLGLAYMASHRVGASAPQSLLDKVPATAPQPVTTLPLTTAPVTTQQPAPRGRAGKRSSDGASGRAGEACSAQVVPESRAAEKF